MEGTIRSRIKELAAQRGMSLPALEQALGFGNSTIVKWDKSSPNVQKLSAVADFFGVSLDYLYNGDDSLTVHDNDLDPEVAEYLDELRNRPEMRMLFSVSRDATKEDIERAVAIIEALRAQGQ